MGIIVEESDLMETMLRMRTMDESPRSVGVRSSCPLLCLEMIEEVHRINILKRGATQDVGVTEQMGYGLWNADFDGW